ncbi:MAG: hypothetical protein AABZ55_03030, partial [Bdellovibrionota bacterium]
MGKTKFPDAILTFLFLTALALLGHGLVSCRNASQFDMVEELKKIAENEKPEKDEFANLKRVQWLESRILGERDASKVYLLRLEKARERLFMGETEAAIRELENLEHEPYPGRVPKFEDKDLRSTLAYLIGTAYLRLAEQQNCISHHNSESCIFPFRGSGMHSELKGGENAAKRFEGLLKESPNDLGLLWLSHLARSALGSNTK